MHPLNRLMNCVCEMTDSKSFVKKHLASRLLMASGGIPLELIAIAQNIIRLPFESTLLLIKLPAKVVNLCISSESFKEFEAGLSGPLQLLKTAFKIFGYTIGVFFTATLGLIRPKSNFRLHTALGLISDEKAEASCKFAQLQAKKLQEAQKKEVENDLRSLILAMREKNIKKEHQIAEEAKKRREIEEAALIMSLKESENV